MTEARPIKSPLLRRYWVEFDVPESRVSLSDETETVMRDWRLAACGVTAFTVDDALQMIRELLYRDEPMPPIRKVIEDVDITTLDRHVRPNIGVPIWRGIWYPRVGAPVR